MKVYSKARSCWVSLSNPNEPLDPMIDLKPGDTLTFKAETWDDASVLDGIMQGFTLLMDWNKAGEFEGMSLADQTAKMYQLLKESTG